MLQGSGGGRGIQNQASSAASGSLGANLLDGRVPSFCKQKRKFAPRASRAGFLNTLYPHNAKGTPKGAPCVAEAEGFEPPWGFPQTVFKTASL